MKKLLRSSISSLTAIAFAFGSLPARANPLGGQVATGSAVITGTGTSQVTVNQSSAKAIIDWRSFNIGAGETTTFVQPNSSAVTLNRVTGGLGLSTINGMINANGGIYVVNPDGILFGPNAKINVGSFLGTTHDIANSDFMAGKYNFTISGNPSASIVNQGSITAANGGFAALVAPGVRNDGIINARLGTVALASGNAFTLDLYGDNLIKLQPSDAIANNVIDAATGQTMTSLVQNTGTLKANGGTVSLTAVTARKVLDSVINSSGTVEANSIGTRNGLVVFGAPTAATKVAGAPTQTVKVSGTIKAAGKKTGTTGGKIQVTGENIQLASANLDASGKVGGGKILIGGDFMGGNPAAPAVTMYGQSFETTPIPTATQVTVDAYSTLNASAITTGNGGKVVVWSNVATNFGGSIVATGGSTSGNGGFVEVSGESALNFAGIANLTATSGLVGNLLLDPTGDLYIVSDSSQDQNFTVIVGARLQPTAIYQNASSQSFLRASTIVSLLNTSNVYIYNSNGDIYINAPIVAPAKQYDSLTISNSSEPSFYSSTFNASTITPLHSRDTTGNIYLNAPIDFSATIGGSLNLAANNYIISGTGGYIVMPSNLATTIGQVGSPALQVNLSEGVSSNGNIGIGTAAAPIIIVTPVSPLYTTIGNGSGARFNQIDSCIKSSSQCVYQSSYSYDNGGQQTLSFIKLTTNTSNQDSLFFSNQSEFGKTIFVQLTSTTPTYVAPNNTPPSNNSSSNTTTTTTTSTTTTPATTAPVNYIGAPGSTQNTRSYCQNYPVNCYGVGVFANTLALLSLLDPFAGEFGAIKDGQFTNKASGISVKLDQSAADIAEAARNPEFYYADGAPKYPTNGGFLGDPSLTMLQPGYLLDRYGDEYGSFLSPLGTPFEARSLPPSSYNYEKYSQFQVVIPLPVETGPAAPWFSQPGGGMQYRTGKSIEDLLRGGYLKCVGGACLKI